MTENETKYVARMGDTSTVWTQTLAAAITLFPVLTNVYKELNLIVNKFYYLVTQFLVPRPFYLCLLSCLS
jgi:hypothetical protein